MEKGRRVDGSCTRDWSIQRPKVPLKNLQVFFLVSWGGVRLSPLGTSATNWPIVPAPDDR
jgi:hypothetical protein